jgi:hypothetical protein
MDAAAWVLGAAAVGGTLLAVAWAPWLHRSIRRVHERGGSGMAGVAGGLDAVWRPSVDEVARNLAIQQVVPAPAPSPGDPGRMQDGRIIIDVAPLGRVQPR